MPRYIFVAEKSYVWDRYRVLEPGELVGGIDEVEALSGVISAAVADEFKEELERHYQPSGFSVREGRAESWAELKRALKQNR